MKLFSGLSLFFSLFLLIILGVPIAISLGASTMLTMFSLDIPLSAMPQRIFTSLDVSSIMAIPFFVLVGNIMTEGGISKKLVTFANHIIGNVRGGLAYAAVLACVFFAALSGSAPATVIAIGSMLYPEMIALGYNKERAAGLFVVSGGLGPIIPPSIIMIVYCTITNNSVGDMFKAGIGVGTMVAVMLIGLCIFFAYKEKWPKNTEKFSLSDLFKSFFGSIPALLMPIIILGGIYSGLLTPTESGAIAAVFALFVGLFVYKTLNKKNVVSIMLNSAKSSAMLLFIIGASTAFSWVFTISGISNSLVEAIQSMSLSPMLFAIIIAVIVVIFGTFMDGIAICVLLVPILWPVAQSLGLSGIHFGIIVSMGGVVGTMTPPVAVSLFAAASFTKMSIGQIVKGQLPFFIGFLLVYFLAVIFPKINTFLL
ncbi:MAG: TRAP transporter large permease [Elusimicrobiota bacterium]|jgi:C4-dicarboxylate transporter DctM subunit|nr:TRAP transporter large permease [Elusimicrobiota bacterium]